jgi:RNA polymerase sigma factor (sigma-70 family)
MIETGGSELGANATLVAYFDAVGAEVYRYVSRLTGGDRALTEDIVQDAFCSLVRKSAREGVHNMSPGFAMVVARNRFLDHVRSQARERRRWHRIDVAADEVDGPEHSVAAQDRAHRLLAALPALERCDLPIADIARLIGRSEAATSSLLARARRRLRRLLDSEPEREVEGTA